MVNKYKSRRQTCVANRLKKKEVEIEKRKKERGKRTKDKMDAWLCLLLLISLSDQQVIIQTQDTNTTNKHRVQIYKIYIREHKKRSQAQHIQIQTHNTVTECKDRTQYSKCLIQATEPYNNEESASRDEGGTSSADSQISADNNMDNIRDIDIDNIDKISDIDNTSNIDNIDEVWTGEIDADENRDSLEKMKNRKNISESDAAVINSNKITGKTVRKNRVSEGALVTSEMAEEEVNMKEEVNSKEMKTSNSMSRTRTTTVSTDGLVEMERLRTQVCETKIQ